MKERDYQSMKKATKPPHSSHKNVIWYNTLEKDFILPNKAEYIHDPMTQKNPLLDIYLTYFTKMHA